MKQAIVIALASFFIGFAWSFSASPQSPNTVLLTEKNTVVLRGPIDREMATYVVNEMNRLAKERKNLADRIYVVIDSEGGNLGSALYMVEIANGLGNVAFVALNSFSAGAYMMQFSRSTRYMVDGGSFMVHQPSIDCTKAPSMPVATCKKLFKEEVKRFLSLVAERIGMPDKAFVTFVDKQKFLNASEAKQMNFIDEVVSVECSENLKKQRIELNVTDNGITYVSKSYSACPLIRAPLESR
jgi:ATP-dependent protease ClpP protease subunit